MHSSQYENQKELIDEFLLGTEIPALEEKYMIDRIIAPEKN